MLRKVRIFNSFISIGSFNRFAESILKLSDLKKSSYVCFANVHMLIEAHKNPSFQTILNNADIVTPDGKPVSVIMNLNYKVDQERVAGMDLFPELLKLASKAEKSVFFYGSTNFVLEKIKNKALKQYPGLKIVGTYSPPFRTLTQLEDQEVVNLINSKSPDLVFVALGCPKQEIWMYDHLGKIYSCMLGVGQAFLTFAELESRLPNWARNLSLEWMFRLYQDPKRLWKRYLVTNSLFLILVIRSVLRPKFLRKKR